VLISDVVFTFKI